jgi:hypothetical protein
VTERAESLALGFRPRSRTPATLTFDANNVLCLFLNTAPTPSATQHPDPAPDRAAERFAILRELVDIGMEIARAVQGEIRARAEVVEDEAAESPKIVAASGRTRAAQMNPLWRRLLT